MIAARHLPGRLGGEELERRFVGRGQLLEVLVADLAATVHEGGGRYILLSGPEGSGKTHLLHLALHRLGPGFASRIVMVGEEIPAFQVVDLWERALGRGCADEDGALRALDAEAGRTRLLFVVEQLDRLFAAIGSAGQGRLRAALENHRSWSLVGTARAPGLAFSDRRSPFYQTFVRHLLRPFSPAEARAMLERLGEIHGDDALVAALEGPAGLARVKALHHLVGGAPRAWAMLHPHVRDGSLTDPVSALLALADDLAPVWAERSALLPEGQRPLVEQVARAWRPMRVGELAVACHQTHQTTSSQLRRLGPWMRVVPTGRERGYELADPLLGLVRASLRTELLAFARFLVAWVEPEPRLRWRERLPAPTATDDAARALLGGWDPGDPELDATRAALAWTRGESPAMPAGPIRLENWLAEVALHRSPAVVARLGAQVGLERLGPEDRVVFLHALRTAGDPDRAWRLVDDALRGVEEGREATRLRLRLLLASGRADEALAAAERASQRWPGEAAWREWAAAAANTVGLASRAEAHAEEATRLDPEAGRAWYVLGVARCTLGRFAEAARALAEARRLLPRAAEPATFLELGALLGAGRHAEAHALLPLLGEADRLRARALLSPTAPMLPFPAADARRYRIWLHAWLAWMAGLGPSAHGAVLDRLRGTLSAIDDELRAAVCVGLGRLAASAVPGLDHGLLAFLGVVDSVVDLGPFTPILDALATLPGSTRRYARLAAAEREVLRELLRAHGKEGILPAPG